MVAVKISSLATTRESRTDFELPSNSPGNCHLFDLLSPWKKCHSQDSFLFHLTQISSSAISPIHRASVKTNQWQLFNAAAAWGGNTSWGKQAANQKT